MQTFYYLGYCSNRVYQKDLVKILNVAILMFRQRDLSFNSYATHLLMLCANNKKQLQHKAARLKTGG